MNEFINNNVILFVALCLVGFGIFWSVLSVFLSRLSKWHILAQRFPDTAQGAKGEKRSLEYMRVGMVRYKHAVNCEALAQGLRVSMFPLFIGHKSFLVPWQELTIIETKRFFYAYELSFSSVPLAPRVWVTKGLGEWITEKKKLMENERKIF